MGEKHTKPKLSSPEALKGTRNGHARWPKCLVIALLAAVAAACWGLAQWVFFEPAVEIPQPTPRPERIYLIERPLDQVAQVRIESADFAGYTLSKLPGDAGYAVEGQPQFALDPQIVERIWMSAATLIAQTTVAESAADLSVYGLDMPKLFADIRYIDGESARISFGDQTPVGGQYYMRLGDQRTVYTVASIAFIDMNYSLNALHALLWPMTLDARNLSTLLIEQPEGANIQLEVLSENEGIRLRQPYDIEANSARAQALLEAACELSLDGYAGHADAQDSLAQYGLDSPKVRIHFAAQTGERMDVRIGIAADDLRSYACIDDSGDVYTVPTYQLAFLAGATPAKLIDPHAGQLPVAQLDALILSGNGTEYAFSILREKRGRDDGTMQTVETYEFGGQPLDKSAFDALYQAITGLTFDKIREDADAKPLGELLMRVQFVGDASSQVDYLAYDADYCAISRDGHEFLLIKREKVLDVLRVCAGFD